MEKETNFEIAENNWIFPHVILTVCRLYIGLGKVDKKS